jgi:glycerol-3-phosphate dehydrogenase
MGEAGRITGRDVAELLRLLNAHLASRTAVRDIVSLRSGVRALAVPAVFEPTGDLRRLSRRHRIHPDPVLPWVSVYGGKLSGCLALAADVTRQVETRIGRRPSGASPGSRALPVAPLEESFPTLNQPVTPAAWSVQHELCCCLEDYLRRRTNIAQWVPRGGLGRRLEFIDHVRGIARVIHSGDIVAAEQDLARYHAAIDEDWRLVDPDAITPEERGLTWSH